ncbi:MAG: hypothetical protein H6Q47_141 [Deltaproteobacteria bacterium]|nr:hypothetical protein [Deltaproteobacteria bacterium]
MTKNSKQYLNFRSFFANSFLIFSSQRVREKKNVCFWPLEFEIF